jgi:hypothetical protein
MHSKGIDYLEIFLKSGQHLILTMVEISIKHVRFEVFTAVTMKNGVFWDVTPQRASVASYS